MCCMWLTYNTIYKEILTCWQTCWVIKRHLKHTSLVILWTILYMCFTIITTNHNRTILIVFGSNIPSGGKGYKYIIYHLFFWCMFIFYCLMNTPSYLMEYMPKASYILTVMLLFDIWYIKNRAYYNTLCKKIWVSY